MYEGLLCADHGRQGALPRFDLVAATHKNSGEVAQKVLLQALSEGRVDSTEANVESRD